MTPSLGTTDTATKIATDSSAEQPAEDLADTRNSITFTARDIACNRCKRKNMIPKDETQQKKPRQDLSAAQPAHIMLLPRLIHSAPPRDPAKANVGTICRNWRQIYGEQPWRIILLGAANPPKLHKDWSTSYSHDSVDSLMSAPQELQTRGTFYSHRLPWVATSFEVYTESVPFLRYVDDAACLIMNLKHAACA